MTAICPHCGYDLQKGEPVHSGMWRYALLEGVSLAGRRLPVKPQAHLVLGALMRANGRVLTADALAERLGYEGDNAIALLASIISQARGVITDMGIHFPVESVRCAGWRWNLAAVPSANVTRRVAA